MNTATAPELRDFASFGEFEQALTKWHTPEVVEEVAEQYQILAYRDGTFRASVWAWLSHDSGYWAVANTCWNLSSLEGAKTKVMAMHVPHIYRPSDTRRAITSAIPAGYAVTSTGETVLIEDWDEVEGAM